MALSVYNIIHLAHSNQDKRAINCFSPEGCSWVKMESKVATLPTFGRECLEVKNFGVSLFLMFQAILKISIFGTLPHKWVPAYLEQAQEECCVQRVWPNSNRKSEIQFPPPNDWSGWQSSSKWTFLQCNFCLNLSKYCPKWLPNVRMAHWVFFANFEACGWRVYNVWHTQTRSTGLGTVKISALRGCSSAGQNGDQCGTLATILVVLLETEINQRFLAVCYLADLDASSRKLFHQKPIFPGKCRHQSSHDTSPEDTPLAGATLPWGMGSFFFFFEGTFGCSSDCHHQGMAVGDGTPKPQHEAWAPSWEHGAWRRGPFLYGI